MPGPLERLEEVTKILRKTKGNFAVAGGIVANLFRPEPRLTQDVDLLLIAEQERETEELAVKILKKLGLHVGYARESDLRRAPMMNKKSTPVVMLVGRDKGQEADGGVDILLPRMPWVKSALLRAQHHLVDFGFAKLPTITLEDFIVSKAFALRDNPTRYKDLDDLKSILEGNREADIPYLASEFDRFSLSLPKELLHDLPKALRRALHGTRKQNRPTNALR